ncbi:hypothetical protein PVAP13_9NG238646 [Panicum virgatum]|uniref:Uncharacterized protein n=1 Tax=Panicum virgatum TaxID=38727 RepID=A0A8T0MIX9_PANVG|nr:hypothetical protein PVAP13_9NG238646 [Panicum virgatum]
MRFVAARVAFQFFARAHGISVLARVRTDIWATPCQGLGMALPTFMSPESMALPTSKVPDSVVLPTFMSPESRAPNSMARASKEAKQVLQHENEKARKRESKEAKQARMDCLCVGDEGRQVCCGS